MYGTMDKTTSLDASVTVCIYRIFKQFKANNYSNFLRMFQSNQESNPNL